MRRLFREGGYGPRLFAALALGFVSSLFAATVAGWTLAAAERLGAPAGATAAYRDWLATGGWLKLPMWGAAIATLVTLPRAVNLPQRLVSGWFLLELGVMPFLLHTQAPPPSAEPAPVTVRERLRAILRWSYHTPGTVARIVTLSRDRDPMVREQAVVALGLNVVVSDIEHASVTRPSRFAASPVRDSLRVRLFECLGEPVERVRAEAARALWNAPLTFGRAPAAAETLAAVLDRAAGSPQPGRVAWLALDAAAGAPAPELQAAAGRFARATPDPELARYARLAAANR